MGVEVPLAIVQLFHQSGRGVSDMERNGETPRLLDRRPHLAVTDVEGVAFRCGCEIDDRLRKGQFPLGGAEEVIGLHRVDGHGQRARVGVPDILGGKADQPPGDIERILSGHQHPAEPVEGRVGIAPPEALVERGDDVVMLLPALVVLERLFLDRLFDEGAGDQTAVHPCIVGERDRRFEAVQRGARVPICRPDDMVERLRLDIEAEGAEPPFMVQKRVPDDPGEVLPGERLEGEDAHPGEKRRNHLERGVFRRRPDQRDQAALDMGEKSVLLRLVEAVNLIHEEDRPAPVEPPQFGGLLNDGADLLHAGEDRREADEVRFCLLGQDPGERRLPRTGRSPEDDGKEPVLFHSPSQQTLRAQQVALADILVETPRPHPLGQWPVVVPPVLLIKKFHSSVPGTVAIGIPLFFTGLLLFFLTQPGRLDDLEKRRHPVFRGLAPETIPYLRRQRFTQVVLDREGGIPAADDLPAGKLSRLMLAIGKGDLPAEPRTTDDPILE